MILERMIMMKIKYANSVYSTVIENSFKSIEVNKDGFNGYISLVNIKKVSKPQYVPRRDNKQEKILDENLFF